MEVVKMFQAFHINWDLEMDDEETDTYWQDIHGAVCAAGQGIRHHEYRGHRSQRPRHHRRHYPRRDQGQRLIVSMRAVKIWHVSPLLPCYPVITEPAAPLERDFGRGHARPNQSPRPSADDPGHPFAAVLDTSRLRLRGRSRRDRSSRSLYRAPSRFLAIAFSGCSKLWLVLPALATVGVASTSRCCCDHAIVCQINARQHPPSRSSECFCAA